MSIERQNKVRYKKFEVLNRWRPLEVADIEKLSDVIPGLYDFLEHLPATPEELGMVLMVKVKELALRTADHEVDLEENGE